MNKIAGIYAGSSYEIRLKAPIAAAVEVGVALLLLPLALIQFAEDSAIQGIAILVLAGVFIFTLVLLLRGRYDLSVRVFNASAATVMILNQFVLQGYSNALTFAQFALLQLALLSLIALLIRQRSIFRLYIVLAVLSFWGYVLFVVVSGQSARVDMPFVSQLDVAGFTHTLGIIVLYQMKRVFDLVTQDAESQFAQSEKQRQAMDGIMRQAAAQLEGTLGLKTEAESAEASTHQINRRVEDIGAQVERLHTIFTDMMEALKDIGANMDTLSDRAQEQSANVTESSAAIEQMVTSINSVAGIIDQRKASVEALQRTADSGTETIKRTENSFNEVVNKITNIREITSLISGIAAQTNLLAMNAAIEAAHAGDAGRGFAVVADEIRKLAENSSVNAKSIADNLKELISSIETAGGQVADTGDSFSEIQAEVKQVADAMDEIFSSTQELNSGSGEILKATANLSGLTTNVLDSVGEVTRDNKIIASNIEHGGSVAGELKVEAADISRESESIVQAATKILAMAQILTRQSEALNDHMTAEDHEPVTEVQSP